MTALELLDAIRVELLERDADRAREVLVFVLVFGQHLDELGAVLEQPLHFIAAN